jgi:hypothetical protein
VALSVHAIGSDCDTVGRVNLDYVSPVRRVVGLAARLAGLTVVAGAAAVAADRSALVRCADGADQGRTKRAGVIGAIATQLGGGIRSEREAEAFRLR